MKLSEIPQLKKLTKAEKILLVEELWDEIVKDESDIAVPDNHLQELENRLESHKKFPDALLTFDELQQNIEKWK